MTVQDFSFTTAVSKASPKLFLACASGQHLKTALLTVRRAGGQQQEFLKLTLSDVTVSGYFQVDSPEADPERPLDQVRMNFAKLEVSYSGQRPDGSPDAPVTAGWDFRKNTKI